MNVFDMLLDSGFELQLTNEKITVAKITLIKFV